MPPNHGGTHPLEKRGALEGAYPKYMRKPPDSVLNQPSYSPTVHNPFTYCHIHTQVVHGFDYQAHMGISSLCVDENLSRLGQHEDPYGPMPALVCGAAGHRWMVATGGWEPSQAGDSIGNLSHPSHTHTAPMHTTWLEGTTSPISHSHTPRWRIEKKQFHTHIHLGGGGSLRYTPATPLHPCTPPG